MALGGAAAQGSHDTKGFMSDPQSPEAMKPETSETPGAEGAPAGGGEQAAPAGAEGGAPKAQAYVDPEIAQERSFSDGRRRRPTLTTS